MTAPNERRAPAVQLMVGALCATLTVALPVSAQSADTAAARPADSVSLQALQDSALARDPRAGNVALDRQRARLRLDDIAAERLPSVGATALGQYQSQVTTIDVALPGGIHVPTPSKDSYDAYVMAQEPLFDPSRGPRRAVAAAQRSADESAVHSSLFPLRQDVNEAFFDAALLQAQEAEIDAVIADLQTQLTVASSRVREGAALPGDSAGIMAELLRRRQDRSSLEHDRDASLAVLADLTGATLAPAARLALPALGDAVDRARANLDSLHARPEYAQFNASRTLLDAQRTATAAATRPRVSAFARAGYARPGLDFLSDRFQWYWLAGIQLGWAPFTWGSNERDQHALELERRTVDRDESAFRASMRRAATRATAQIDFLDQAVAGDDGIVSLREEAAREARLRYDEGVITAAEYIDRETDLLNARLARATHRVQLAQARANYLTMLGLEVR